MKITYNISEVRPYINWLYFFHSWGLTGKPEEEKVKLKADAERKLDTWEGHYHTHAAFEILDANSDGDDLILGGVRIPMLRQQFPSVEGHANLCLADFVRPLSSGITDKAGVFATSTDPSMEKLDKDDVYEHMMSEILAERLAEGTAELVHLQVRKTYWGYAPDEDLSLDDLLVERYQGIRPAVGYPSLPDASVNFIISDLIGMKEIGIRLTENGMMRPKASVSGLMFAHPKSFYFDLGKIGEDQLKDYAQRRGLPIELIRRFLGNRLLGR